MRTLSLLLVLVAAACDAPTLAASAAAPAAAATVARAPALETTPAPAPALETTPAPAAPAATLGSCISACDHGKRSRADRAACRLDCEAVHGVTAQAPGADDPVGQAVSCMRGCPQGDGTRACATACGEAAAALKNAPAPTVLAELGACMSACRTERVATETDRTTCELTCEQNARVAGPAQPGPR